MSWLAALFELFGQPDRPCSCPKKSAAVAVR